MENVNITMINSDDLAYIKERITAIEKKLKPNPLDDYMLVDDLVAKFPGLNKRNVINWINSGKVDGKRVGKATFVNIKSMGLV